MKLPRHRAIQADRDRRARYEMARLPREMTSAIHFYMEQNRISQRELADRLDITPGRVSQILSGTENLTLRTLATVTAAMDAHFNVELVKNAPAAQRQGRPVSAELPVLRPAPGQPA